MTVNVYEGMFILDSNRYARDPRNIAEQIPAMVKQFQGEVLASRLWSEQKLAYPIKGHRKGTYWLSYFRLDSSKLSDLKRASKLNENILRSLVLKLDPRLVNVMVEHARSGGAPKTETAAKVEAADRDEDEGEAEE